MGHALKTAIFKIVGEAGSYVNEDAVEKIIKYVLKQEKRQKHDLWGSIGTIKKSEKGITEDFHKIKRLYEKEDGLQLKHLVLSWGQTPDLPRKKMRKLIKRTLSFWGMEYQVVYAVHEDKMGDRYHMHIVLNSVSNTGKKIQITGKKLNRFKRKFNNIWNPYGYMLKMQNGSETIKGKSFECDS